MTAMHGEWWGDPANLPIEQPMSPGGRFPATALVVQYHDDVYIMLNALNRDWIQRVRLFSFETWTKDDRRANAIINDYLNSQDRDLLLCQDTLIEAGLERYARLS